MAIAASGAVSLADFRTEFVGGSSAISLGDLYRGGSHIRAKAGNSSATNLAASVPTSGTIDFADFYSQAKGFQFTYTSGATNQNINAKFGDDYGVNYPKFVVINSGVELGASNTSNYALAINSGLSGTITLTNNGTISGAGGSANGGTGGDALSFSSSNSASNVIFNNNGTVVLGEAGAAKVARVAKGEPAILTMAMGQTRNPNSHPQFLLLLGPRPKLASILEWPRHKWRTTSDDFSVRRFTAATVHGGTQRISGLLAPSLLLLQLYDITREQQLTGYNYYNGGSGGSGGV